MVLALLLHLSSSLLRFFDMDWSSLTLPVDSSILFILLI